MVRQLHRFRVIAYAVMALFSTSLAVQAQNLRAFKVAAKSAKVAPDLYQFMQSNGPQVAAAFGGVIVETNQVFKNGKIAIEAVANNGDGQGLLNQLKALGLTEGIAYKGKIFGYLPVDKIRELKNVSSLSFADSYYKPETNTGSVTSQGDAALKADVARATYSVTGSGVKVGVLSDSYNNLGGAAAGVASGDLPADVQVLQELPSGGSDEGRAMAEIVYDVAPGAALAFNTAFLGEAGFAQGIINLAAAGCQVIVDDIGYLNAPMFQDGLVAQAVNQVVNNNGVTYFSAAANSGRSSYQAPYKNGGTYTNADFYGDNTAYPTHDFGSGTVDNLQQITIPVGGRLRLALQWDNPYQSISGGIGATTDLDLLIVNSATGALVAGSGRDQSSGGDPWELTGTLTNNTGAPLNVNVIIVKYSGPDPGLIKWVNFGSRTIVPEYDTQSSTSYGHANAAGAIGVGAAAYFQTPVFNGASTATIEAFSSAGGTPILFTTDGSRINGITGTVRQQPAITSVDGGDNTFFGSDFEGNGKPNFFGTSAAAPHAAGVAALMKQKVPAITRNTILSTLQSTALDMDDPSTPGFDTGFDFGTGYGFIQADKALQAISPAVVPLTITLTANPTTILTTGTTTLTATVTGGTTPYTYTFTGPGTITPSGNMATVSGLPAGMQTFTVTATDGSTPAQTISGMVSVTVNEPTPTGAFAITGVTTLSCSPVSGNPNQRSLTFTPQYNGVNGQPITFSVANEKIPTTAPGPYTLAIYIDNPTITLKATQQGTSGEVSFAYNWLAMCGTTPTNTAPTVANAIPNQTATVGTAFSYMIPTNTFTDAETPSQLTLSVSGLPAGLMFTAPATISGTPTMNGMSSVTVTATDPGALSTNTQFTITVNPASVDPGTFAITGVTTVNCSPMLGNPNQRSLTFTPLYSGLNGQPVTFSVANESIPTTAPGPYTLAIYIDNPTITLRASQQGTSGQVTFAYNWLAVCGSSSARLGAESDNDFQVLLLGNPVQDGRLSVLVSGVANQPVNMSLIDMRGKVVNSHQIEWAGQEERHVFEVGRQPTGLLLLKVSTPYETKTIKVLKAE